LDVVLWHVINIPQLDILESKSNSNIGDTSETSKQVWNLSVAIFIYEYILVLGRNLCYELPYSYDIKEIANPARNIELHLKSFL